MKKNKFVCIHGHFYQPPRENAWLEVIEMQDSATPFHDWNERINFECYAPNATARILDDRQNIIKIINNYTRISSNFGPTLLAWMEKADPDTYYKILEADRISQSQNNGHGSALAQVYNHTIIPLCNERDKETQIIWGIKDFEHRFKRFPEGMWLAETAVDTQSLELMAKHGIKFTILAPRQIKRVKKVIKDKWHDVNEHSIDTRRPYRCNLPSGRSIDLFVYHGENSQGVAFKGFLNNGKYFAQNLMSIFDDNDKPQISHIATDGESYGHHHRKGEMALADCLNHIEEQNLAQIINYGAYLELYPPKWEAEIHENSSWSCVHGVERWKSDCGCSTGDNPHWNQAWRGPLREVLDDLRGQVAPIFEKTLMPFVDDAWELRDKFIDVVLNRSEENVDAFFKEHINRDISDVEKTTLLRALEMQRHAMLMYTSCAWFFDDISRIETDQVLQYANRVIYYAQQLSGVDLHDAFLKGLEKISSNYHQDGSVSYLNNVAPARLDLTRVGMHYAASSLFEAYPEHLEFFNYVSDNETFERLHAGINRLAYGRTWVQSQITHSRKHFSFIVLYLGQQNILGYISTDMPLDLFNEMKEKVTSAFTEANLGEVISLMPTYFGEEKFTTWHLFRDEKRKILDLITQESIKSIETLFRQVYKNNYVLMNGIQASNAPVPKVYLDAIRFIVNQDLYNFFKGEHLNLRTLSNLVNEFNKWNIEFNDIDALQLVISERILEELKIIIEDSPPAFAIETLIEIIKLLRSIGLEPDIWKSQNIYFEALKRFENVIWEYPTQVFEKAYLELGKHLNVITNMNGH